MVLLRVVETKLSKNNDTPASTPNGGYGNLRRIECLEGILRPMDVEYEVDCVDISGFSISAERGKENAGGIRDSIFQRREGAIAGEQERAGNHCPVAEAQAGAIRLGAIRFSGFMSL